MTYKDPTWGWPTKLGLGAILLTLSWFSVPSSAFFKPLNMAVLKTSNGHWIVVSERLLPFGAVSGRTHAIAQVLGRADGQECQWTTDGLYVPRENNITRYDVTSWAGPCLDAGPPISIRFSRTVYLGGFIPLRPVYYSFMLNPDNAPVITEE